MEKWRRMAITLITIVSVFNFGNGFVLRAQAESEVSDLAKTLPKIITCVTYGTGGSGYVELATIGEAFRNKYGVKWRMIPSDTSMGRITPLASGLAMFSGASDELYFANECLYEFALLKDGPIEIRQLLAPANYIGMITTAGSEIKTLTDLKGKKVSYQLGNISLNIKATTALAFAGLTWDDVIPVPFPGYADEAKSIMDGSAAASCVAATSTATYEIASGPKGMRWLEMPASDKEGWKRAQIIMPWGFPGPTDFGAGLTEGKPVTMIGYRYPTFAALASLPDDVAYAMVKAFDETYPEWKDATKGIGRWELKKCYSTPGVAAVHPGAVKYFKEKGLWTAEDEAWNKARLEHHAEVRKLWDATAAEAKAKGITGKDFRDLWMQKRAAKGWATDSEAALAISKK